MNRIVFRRNDSSGPYADYPYYMVEIELDGREEPEVSDRIFLNALQAHRLNAEIVRVLTEDDVRNAASEESEVTR